MDREVYLDFIKKYSRYEKKDIGELFFIAEKLKISDEVREIMELIYE